MMQSLSSANAAIAFKEPTEEQYITIEDSLVQDGRCQVIVYAQLCVIPCSAEEKKYCVPSIYLYC